MRPPLDDQITFLYTRDLPATAHFYEQVLQLPLVLDQGKCRIYAVAPHAYLGFCLRSEAPEQPQGVIVTLVTHQVDEWHRHLIDHGVVIEKPPQYNAEYHIYHCFFRDPNGYVIEIQRFLSLDWPG
jgi:catechol 2,3-dioxygenase-like lactoylglutathione lyase family enzyme